MKFFEFLVLIHEEYQKVHKTTGKLMSDVDVKLGMWFGPGSPSIELFEVEEVRSFGQPMLVICGADPSRVSKWSGQSAEGAKEQAARSCELIADQLRTTAKLIRESA